MGICYLYSYTVCTKKFSQINVEISINFYVETKDLFNAFPQSSLEPVREKSWD